MVALSEDLTPRQLADIRAEVLAKGFYPGDDIVDDLVRAAFQHGYMMHFSDAERMVMIIDDLKKEGLWPDSRD